MTASPLRGRYLVRNRAWNAWLRLSDAALELLPRTDPPARSLPAPRRILLAVGGHLGDAIIATSALAPIREVVPDAEIGVVAGSWTRPIFERHPTVAHFHAADHWKTSRANRSLPARWITWRETRARAVAEIRGRRYDAAVDLAAYYPNYAGLLRASGVPIRVGFTSGGRGALYTHPITWRSGDHCAEDHRRLLQTLFDRSGFDAPLRYDVALRDDALVSAATVLARLGLEPRRYVILHVGAGMQAKEWPHAGWREVIAELHADGYVVALTGTGTRQRSMTEALARGRENVVNLCDELNWVEFHGVVQAAACVISVDTATTHLAAAAGIPCVVLMTGMDVTARWAPVGNGITVLTKAVPCAPCYRSRGCGAMWCVRGVSSSDVVTAARSALS